MSSDQEARRSWDRCGCRRRPCLDSRRDIVRERDAGKVAARHVHRSRCLSEVLRSLQCQGETCQHEEYGGNAKLVGDGVGIDENVPTHGSLAKDLVAKGISVRCSC